MGARRGGVLAGMWATWVVIQLWVPAPSGHAVTPLITVPIVVTAWLLGARRGVIGAVVALGLNFALLWARGALTPTWEDWRVVGQGLGSVMGVVVAWAVGGLRDLSRERNEARERERAAYAALPDDIVLVFEDGTATLLHRPTPRDRLAWPQAKRFPLDAVLPADLCLRVQQLAAQAPPPDDTLTAEFERTGPGGTPQRFEVRGVRATAGEAVCLVRDYSEQRAAEAEIQQAEHANLRSRLETQYVEQQHLVSLGTIAAGLGHEINNPLTYLRGNLDFLKAELHAWTMAPEARVAQEIGQALDEALEGSERIRRLVRDLKVLAPTAALDRMETVDLRAVADAAIAMTQHLAQGKAVVVREYGEVPLIHSNGAALAQVCFNLLANAVQAIAAVPGGPGTIHVRIRASVQAPLTLEVSDTGCGIAPEVLPRIFDPFFTTREVGQGVGLGLAACNTLVRTLGGTISVQTQPGQGTTFRVEIPRGQPDDVRHAPGWPRCPRRCRARAGCW